MPDYPLVFIEFHSLSYSKRSAFASLALIQADFILNSWLAFFVARTRYFLCRRRRSVHNHTWPRPEVCRVRCGTAKPTNLGLSSFLVKSHTNSVTSAGILFSSQPTMASPVKRALPRTGPIRGPPGGHLLPLDHTSFGTKN